MEAAETDDSMQMDDQVDETIPGYASVNEFSQKALHDVVQATRSSNDLPIGDDYDFYSTYPAVREVMDIEGRRILSLLQKVVRYHNGKGNIGPGANMDLEDRFDILMDANDQILEKAGALLDEASGIKKQETKLLIATTPTAKPSTSWNRATTTPNSDKAASAYKLLTARNIQRPQVRFRSKIDNSSRPFKPILREKPNALKTLEESLALPATSTIDESETPDFIHPHPYAFELEAYFPSIEELKTRRVPQEPRPLSETPLTMVNTESQLASMLSDLRKETEIAIDLEHHSYRSFQGLTCLMQISTRTQDYIVDTLELRDSLYVLNEVFTDPKITKVLHGADSDVLWLQRDLGLYLVNLFDTGQAARVLGLSRFSLAHLLMVYVRVEANKQFQLADWRIRPLPQELVNYAREDTHYLLYIYDMMRNQLLDSGNEQANLSQSVYRRSKTVALQVFSKPQFKDEDYMDQYYKSKKVFNARQLAAMKSLCIWRDHMARQEDESYGYVLPNHMLLQIAEILPRERQGVLACCNPIPPLVRQSLPEIHNFVLQAREVAFIKVEKRPVSRPSMSEHPKYDIDSLLNCPHDMTHQDEGVARIEKSISETGLITGRFQPYGKDPASSVNLLEKPVISAFSVPCKKMTRTAAKKLADQVKRLFSNPFTKYFPRHLAKSGKKAVVGHKWRLKPSTNPKKLEEVESAKPDLDSFEPEFVPPTKKPRMSVNLLSASSKTTSSNSSVNSNSNSSIVGGSAASSRQGGLFRVPESVSGGDGGLFKVPEPVADVAKSNGAKDGKKRKKELKDKDPKTLKQQALKIKKVKKKKEKRERLKEEETAKQQTQQISSSSEPLSSSSTAAEDSEEGRKKKKKKKLKINDIGKNFAAFNYDAAEDQLKKEWKEKKKIDVFNPHLPSRDKNKGKKGSKSGKRKSSHAKPKE